MYRHILVPISFKNEESTEAVLNCARALTCEGGKVTLIHVMQPIPTYAASYLPVGYKDDAKAVIAESLLKIAKDIPGASSIVVEGQVANTVVDWAERDDVDCAIMLLSSSKDADIPPGSLIGQLIRRANCAVHLVRSIR